MTKRISVLLILFLNIFCFQSYSQTQDDNTLEKERVFIQEMKGKYNYTETELNEILSQLSPDETILQKISKPAEKTTPWYKYRLIFSDEQRIANGVHFYNDNYEVLHEAYQKHGVSPFIITAIIGVETRYGKVMGKDRVITALSTISFNYPQREAFFTKELKAFLEMSAIEGFDPFDIYGSYAGAMGMAQFMPSSYLNFAVDYEGDGKRDLWTNPNDAIFSVANYLAEHGWQRDGEIVDSASLQKNELTNTSHKPFTSLKTLKKHGIIPEHDSAFTDDTQVGYLELDGDNQERVAFVTFKNFAVITTYNTSPMYAMAVKELADAIAYRIQ